MAAEMKDIPYLVTIGMPSSVRLKRNGLVNSKTTKHAVLKKAKLESGKEMSIINAEPFSFDADKALGKETGNEVSVEDLSQKPGLFVVISDAGSILGQLKKDMAAMQTNYIALQQTVSKLVLGHKLSCLTCQRELIGLALRRLPILSGIAKDPHESHSEYVARIKSVKGPAWTKSHALNNHQVISLLRKGNGTHHDAGNTAVHDLWQNEPETFEELVMSNSVAEGTSTAWKALLKLIKS